MEFSKRLDRFGDEIFAALNEKKVALEAQGRTIYNLSVGTPDFETAPHIRQALRYAGLQCGLEGLFVQKAPVLLRHPHHLPAISAAAVSAGIAGPPPPAP